jgi:tRNA(Ile)-lysidine synthase
MTKRISSGAVLKSFERTILRHSLLRPGDRVLVAFSGGLDSSALLALLLEIREAWSLDIRMAHFNHRLRKNALADARFAEKRARELGLRFHAGEADVRRYAVRRGLNLEEAARTLRYEFLRRTARRINASRIATGHTRNDQAETLLMRLLRGTGPAGLSGVHPEVDGLIIRPLLDLEREDLAHFLKGKGWPFREDETNSDLRFLRNRIRRKLLPIIKKDYEARIIDHLARTAEIFRSEDRLLEAMARKEARIAIRRAKGLPVLDRAALRAMPPAMARRVVRLFLEEVKGDLRDVSFQDVESLRALDKNKEISLADGLILRREGEMFFRKSGAQPEPKYDYLWDGCGTLRIPSAGLSLSGRIMTRPRPDSLRFDDERRVYLDAGKLDFPLRVRNRRNGDRYRPLGAPGAKKLKEILRAKGLSLAERARRPVILSGLRIAWMPGLGVAEEFKVGPKTTRVLVIEKREKL